jgi:hypothetical protein
VFGIYVFLFKNRRDQISLQMMACGKQTGEEIWKTNVGLDHNETHDKKAHSSSIEYSKLFVVYIFVTLLLQG